VLRLDGNAPRWVLNWYRTNKAKWAGNLWEPDAEAIVDAAASAPPNLSHTASHSDSAKPRWKHESITAHRFAGIHSSGALRSAPEDFFFAPEEPLILFEGGNGSGKTSLVNAILWCLTGLICRPQRTPESAEIEFEFKIERSQEGGPNHSGVHTRLPPSRLFQSQTKSVQMRTKEPFH
jgi:hypothetical protein